MIADFTNCFQRNPDILEDVCICRNVIANAVLSLLKSDDDYEDIKYYESELRHYKFYDV